MPDNQNVCYSQIWLRQLISQSTYGFKNCVTRMYNGPNACQTKCLSTKMFVSVSYIDQNDCQPKCLSDKMPVRQMPVRQNAWQSKCLLQSDMTMAVNWSTYRFKNCVSRMYNGSNACRTKCLSTKMFVSVSYVGQNACQPKCLSDKMSVPISYDSIIWSRVHWSTECYKHCVSQMYNSPKCQSARMPLNPNARRPTGFWPKDVVPLRRKSFKATSLLFQGLKIFLISK